MEINLKPIGFVKNAVAEPKRDDWQAITSEIIINEDLKEALSGIDEFSHIVVIYWMHKTPVSERSVTKVHPKRNQNLPLVGVFATRSPARPNPIGMSTVKLLKHRDNVLDVIGLDAVDGTPILDIKPYIPGSDSPTEVRIPAWLSK
ncbi:MAG: tRNA (N6-threonylcarbamoyladenosine(37)-N6)-methyltransferase TrmO [Dehalococcoidia bacterium]|nr:tRNA (N6-threonylcarbamoyladenosine(37)-N6)-methyltransferase TrmO [Dehalococcoidia bacterium]